MNALQLCRQSLIVFTQRNFVADFFKRSTILSGKRQFCVFEPTWGLWATYDDHLRLTGKRVVDFLWMLIELFHYERISVQNRRFRSNGCRLNQNFRQKGSPPPTILLLRKLG